MGASMHQWVFLTFFFLWRSSTGVALRLTEEMGRQWDYAHHGQDWATGQCGSRTRQSPVDFGIHAPWHLKPEEMWGAQSAEGYWEQNQFFYDYMKLTKDSDISFANDGRTLQVNLASNGIGAISFQGAVYNIYNVQFHMASEHTFFQKNFPMEMQMTNWRSLLLRSSSRDLLIHKRDTGEKLVVSVPVQIVPPSEGEADAGGNGTPPGKPKIEVSDEVMNFLEVLQEVAPAEEDKHSVNLRQFNERIPFTREVDLSNLLGNSSEYIEARGNVKPCTSVYVRYYGSETEPPCSETVIWFVRTSPLYVPGLESLGVLKHLIDENTHGGGNNRDPVPLMGRELWITRALQGAGPKEQDKYPPVKGVSKFKPFTADLEAKKALQIANAAMNSARVLKEGVLKAAKNQLKRIDAIKEVPMHIKLED